MSIDRDAVCIGLEKLAQAQGVTLNEYTLEDLTKVLSLRLEEALKNAEEEKFDGMVSFSRWLEALRGTACPLTGRRSR